MKCTMMHRIRGQSNIYEVYEDQIANLFHNVLKIVYLILAALCNIACIQIVCVSHSESR